MVDKKLSKNVQQIVQQAGLDLLTVAASKLRDISTQTMSMVLSSMDQSQAPSLPFVVLPADKFRELAEAAAGNGLRTQKLERLYEFVVLWFNQCDPSGSWDTDWDSLVAIFEAAKQVDPDRQIFTPTKPTRKSRKSGGK